MNFNNANTNTNNGCYFQLTASFEHFANGGIFTNLPGAEQAVHAAVRQLASTQEEIELLRSRGARLNEEVQAAVARLQALEGGIAGVEEGVAMLEGHGPMLEGAVEHWHLLMMDSLAGGRYDEAVYQMGVFDAHRRAHSEWQQALSAAYEERATLWQGVCAQRQWVLELQEEWREFELHWSRVIHRAMVLQQEVEMAWVLVREA